MSNVTQKSLASQFNSRALVIGGTTISQDTEGRYRLNDFHAAAGGEARHAPSNWLKLNATSNLASAIDKSLSVLQNPIPAIKTVKGSSAKQGTYVVKELVYAYAMWIDPNGVMAAMLKNVDDLASVLDALNNFEMPDDMPDMYVYAIQEVSTGNVKIGISKNPEQRLKQLQIGNSSELRLVATKKAENRFKDEKAAHIENNSRHIRSEWFSSGATLSA